MATKKYPLDIVIGATDKAGATLKRVNNRISNIGKPVRRLAHSLSTISRESGLTRVGQELVNVAGRLRTVAKWASVAAIGFTALFKTQFVDTAATFERMETVLETIEGSAETARKSMDWISDFAAKTPYELEEVGEAFVKLRAYGMEPMNGLLRSLGDTSAAMGKPLMQAIEAIADAVTGENERLKEFGIRARTIGKRIVYEYTENGKTMRKVADRSNRAMIQSTLEAIFNSKYAGSMDKLSRTWGGMTSNLADWWLRFKKMVMDSGPFEYLRERLAGLLERLDAMADSGELQELADVVGRRIVRALENAYRWGMRFVDFMGEAREAVRPITDGISYLTGRFGAFNVAATAFAVLIGGKLIAAILSLGATLVGLGVSMSVAFAVPALIVGAIVALVAAGWWLIKNWKRITDYFSGLWQSMKDVANATVNAIRDWFSDMIDSIVDRFTGMINKVRSIANKVRSFFSWGDDDETRDQSNAATSRAMTMRPAGAALLRQPVTSTQSVTREKVEVSVDFKNLPRGVETKAEASGTIPLETNRGYALPGTAFGY